MWSSKSAPQRRALTLIRNSFSFHYRDDDDLVEKSFHDIPDDDAWHFYLSNVCGNCFYYASELVVAGGVIKLAEPPTAAGGHYLEQSARSFERLCKLTISVSGSIMTLFGQCITEIVQAHLLDAVVGEPVTVPGVPPLKDIHIPFFLDETEFMSEAAKTQSE